MHAMAIFLATQVQRLANKLAPTGDPVLQGSGCAVDLAFDLAFDLAVDLAFDLAFDLRRPVKPRWPEFDIDSAVQTGRTPV